MLFKRRRIYALGAVTLVLAGCGLNKEEKELIDNRADGLYGSGDRWNSLESYAKRKSLPKLDEKAMLNDYVSFGIQNNFGLRADFDRWLAAMYAIPRVRSGPEPKLSFNYLLVPIETRTGAQVAQLALSQIFPWFGTYRLQGEVAAKKAEFLWWKVQSKRLHVIRDIKSTYFEYAYLHKAVSISEENLDLLKQIEPVVQSRIQAGEDQSHLLRLQIEIGKHEDQLETLKESRKVLSAKFKALLNHNDEELLPWPHLSEIESIALTKQSLVKTMLKNNPELKGLVEKISMKAKGEELAGKEGYPDLNVGLNHLETEKSKMPVKDSGKDPLALMFSLTIPIDRGKYDAAEKESQAELRAAHADMGQKWNELDSSLESLVFKHADSIRKISLYKDTLIPRAKQNWKVSLSAYKAGKISVLDLIDSEQTLLKFEKTFWKETSNYMINKASLEALCGGELK